MRRTIVQRWLGAAVYEVVTAVCIGCILGICYGAGPRLSSRHVPVLQFQQSLASTCGNNRVLCHGEMVDFLVSVSPGSASTQLSRSSPSCEACPAAKYTLFKG